jgi:nucleoside-diphosphate-sugar epimerase
MAERGHVLVTGAGGFIGSHLVTYLKRQGYWVRGVDLKYPEFRPHTADEFLLLDLRRQEDCLEATRDIEDVYALAADTGGSEFLRSRKALSAYNNSLIFFHTLESARIRRVKRYLLTSSRIVTTDPGQPSTTTPLPNTTEKILLREQTAALEQRFMERFSLQFRMDYGIQTCVVRLPSIFGPFSPWQGGKERVPAALCRKIAQAKLTQTAEVDIWGNGEQTITFCYIDDCVSALHQAMQASHPISAVPSPASPLSINRLADLIADIANLRIVKKYSAIPGRPRQETANVTNVPYVVGPEPQTPVAQGLVATYAWIEERVRAQQAAPPPA